MSSNQKTRIIDPALEELNDMTATRQADNTAKEQQQEQLAKAAKRDTMFPICVGQEHNPRTNTTDIDVIYSPSCGCFKRFSLSSLKSLHSFINAAPLETWQALIAKKYPDVDPTDNKQLLHALVGWLQNGCRGKKFRPQSEQRGGLHKVQDGQYIWNCTDECLSVAATDETIEPIINYRDGKLYCCQGNLISAAQTPLSYGEGQEIVNALESWTWGQPHSGFLLLGWVGSAICAGILRVRPLVWIYGISENGKSLVIKRVLEPLTKGIGKVYDASNSSAAGIRGEIEKISMPIMLDDLDKAGKAKREAYIKLAKSMHDGSVSAMGVQGGGGSHEQSLESCMLFSSEAVFLEDKSEKTRFTSLIMTPLPPHGESLESREKRREKAIEIVNREDTPARLLRRLLEELANIEENIASLNGRFSKFIKDSRACKSLSTMIAFAHGITRGGSMTQEEVLSYESMAQTHAPASEDSEDAKRIINSMMGFIFKCSTYERSLRQLIKIASSLNDNEAVSYIMPKEARAILKAHGLTWVPNKRTGEGKGGAYLKIENINDFFSNNYKEGHWHGKKIQSYLTEHAKDGKASSLGVIHNRAGKGGVTYIPATLLHLDEEEE